VCNLSILKCMERRMCHCAAKPTRYRMVVLTSWDRRMVHFTSPL